MNNIPEGYDENGVRAGHGEWRKPLSQSYIEGRIIEATDYWLDLTDDGDGDYDKGEVELTGEGKVVRDMIIDILEENGIEVV